MQCFILFPGYALVTTANVDLGVYNFTGLQQGREERHCKKDWFLDQS